METGSSAELELVSLVGLKCRDRDEATARTAFEMAVQFPVAALQAALQPDACAGLVAHAFHRQSGVSSVMLWPCLPAHTHGNRQLCHSSFSLTLFDQTALVPINKRCMSCYYASRLYSNTSQGSRRCNQCIWIWQACMPHDRALQVS